MEIAELKNAIAYLSEQIDTLRIEQREHNEVTGENLRQWSQINASLMDCLDRQSEEYQGSASILQALAQHLLTLAHTTQQLTTSTAGLEVSSGKLTLYLEEKQSPQLKQLGENNKQLQASSQKLEEYLVKEQSKRLSLLENGLKSLLEMIQISQERNQALITSSESKKETIKISQPSVENQSILHYQSRPSFNVVYLASSVLLSSAATALLLLLFWQFGGLSSKLSLISDRSEWNLIKLERIESELGIE